MLDFLGLEDTYSEKGVENAILSELEKFILEMGIDFAFLGRKKRITVDNRDYYIDLLFYHRRLMRLVVIELKFEEFEPEHKGQVELLELDSSGIQVAQYLTQMPLRKYLRRNCIQQYKEPNYKWNKEDRAPISSLTKGY